MNCCIGINSLYIFMYWFYTIIGFRYVKYHKVILKSFIFIIKKIIVYYILG